MVTKASAKDACMNFAAFDFFRDRKGMGDAVFQKTSENLIKLGFTVVDVTIFNLDIPDIFQAAIKKTQVVRQQQEKYNYTKAIEEIKGTTRLREESLSQEIKLSESRANANATLILSAAIASSMQVALDIEKTML